MGAETGRVLDATKDSFDELVQSGLVLVDVWADSCRPCVALAPHMERIAAAHADLTIVKLDASKARRKCMALQVRGLPTLILFRDGEEVARITDPSLAPEQVDSWLATELDGLGEQEG